MSWMIYNWYWLISQNKWSKEHELNDIPLWYVECLAALEIYQYVSNQ